MVRESTSFWSHITVRFCFPEDRPLWLISLRPQSLSSVILSQNHSCRHIFGSLLHSLYFTVCSSLIPVRHWPKAFYHYQNSAVVVGDLSIHWNQNMFSFLLDLQCQIAQNDDTNDHLELSINDKFPHIASPKIKIWSHHIPFIPILSSCAFHNVHAEYESQRIDARLHDVQCWWGKDASVISLVEEVFAQCTSARLFIQLGIWIIEVCKHFIWGQVPPHDPFGHEPFLFCRDGSGIVIYSCQFCLILG